MLRLLDTEPVYIRSTGAFLPNDPVPSEDIEHHIGNLENRRAPIIRRKIMKRNGIKHRYYATVNGKPTHLNVDLAAGAVNNAVEESGGVSLEDIGMIASGSSYSDVFVPGLANLVHGKLDVKHSMDCLSSAGVCVSSINALKAASHAVTLGEHKHAVVTGSESASHILQASRYKQLQSEQEDSSGEDEVDPRQAFQAEFLRYMLSDGAACALLDTKPHPSQLSFRIEGFSHHSAAHRLPPCMIAGVDDAGKPLSLEDVYQYKFQTDKLPVLRQDTELLHDNIIKEGRVALEEAIANGFLDSVGGKVDWCLPHLSSYYFYDQCCEGFQEVLGVPPEKVWTNLENVGNVGSASALLLLWGALSEEGPELKKGDTVLLFVPESGNFSYHFVLLSVVDSEG